MKFLIVDTYYPAFLHSLYAKYPLAKYPYAVQWRILMDQCFGTANYYSLNLQKLGYEATEIVANCRPLQMQWAQEHGLKIATTLQRRSYRGFPLPWVDKDWFYPVLLEQIKEYRPDVIHFQAPAQTDPHFLRAIRPYARLITAQIASPYPDGYNFREYDVMLSSFPHFVQKFQTQGIRSRHFNLGFEQSLLQRIKKSHAYDVVFVGGISRSHKDRIHFLEEIARHIPVHWWGYGIEQLKPSSPLRKTYHGQAWGLDMYDALHSAKFVLNRHINVARNYANNMRLYESTGVSSLLVTDHKDNLYTLFVPDKEIVAYHSPQECIDEIRYYLAHEDERKAIALAGQQRTLREHTYYHRMQEFVEIVKPLL